MYGVMGGVQSMCRFWSCVVKGSICLKYLNLALIAFQYSIDWWVLRAK